VGVEDGDFSEYIGMVTGQGTLVVERAPVSAFARAVLDDSAVYRNAEVARTEGFDNIPVPPTFGFSLQNWGKWEELQPAVDPGARSPMVEIMGGLMSKGGMVLHGEQSFEYHRPMVAGEKLTFRGEVKDVYQKATGDRTMTFLVTEDTYLDEKGEKVLTSTMNLLHRS
jgi:acyl dehydratase